MLYHDTHVHLDILLEQLGLFPDTRNILQTDLENLLKDNSKIENIQTSVTNFLENHSFLVHSTVSTQNYLLVSKLFKNVEKVRFLIGSHPEIVDENFNLKTYLEEQKEHLNFLYSSQKNQDFFIKNRVIGIGECGLDYHYTQSKDLIKTQKELFESQIQLAIENNLTLVIHCREAFADLFDILKNYEEIHNKFLVHCFTSNKDDLRKVQDFGGKAAFGGIITFGQNAQELRDALNFCSLDSLVLETDLPFLSPNPKRGQPCLPEFIDFVGKKAAEIKNLTEEEIWDISLKNTLNLFPLLKLT